MPPPDDSPARLRPTNHWERWIFYLFAVIILFLTVTVFRFFMTGGTHGPVPPAFGRALIAYWSRTQTLPQSKGIYGPDALWEVVGEVNPGRESVMYSLLFARDDMPLWPLKPKKGTEFWETWDIEIPTHLWAELDRVAASEGQQRFIADRDEETLVWAWRRGWASNPRSRETVIPMGGHWVEHLTPEQLSAALKHTRMMIELSRSSTSITNLLRRAD